MKEEHISSSIFGKPAFTILTFVYIAFLFMVVRFKVKFLQDHVRLSVLAYMLYIACTSWLYLSSYTMYWQFYLKTNENIKVTEVNNFYTVKVASDLWFSVVLATFINNQINRITYKNALMYLGLCFLGFNVFGSIVFGNKSENDNTPTSITEAQKHSK